MSEKEVSYEQLEETEAVVRSACSVYSVVSAKNKGRLFGLKILNIREEIR